jgi:uncharacterized Zn-finger protein
MMNRKLPAPKKWHLIVESNNSKVKCDAPGCGYETPATLDDMEAFIAIDCPMCGAPLLTIEDWNSMVILNKIMGNPIIRFINWAGGKMHMKQVKHRATWDGSGTLHLEKVDTN